MPLPIALIQAAVGGGIRVTLSGEAIARVQTSPSNALCSLIINTDGTVDKFSGSQSQIDAATDWIIPNSQATILYEVRVTNVNFTQAGDGASFSVAFEVDDTWKALDADATWQITQNSDTPAAKSVDFDLQIRLGSGPTLASAAYSLTATVV